MGGEAIATGIAQMTTAGIASVDQGAVAVIQRVIMERDTYNLRWGFGPRAQEKKKLILAGKLDKNGKANASTPRDWMMGSSYLPALTSTPEEIPKEESNPQDAEVKEDEAKAEVKEDAEEMSE